MLAMLAGMAAHASVLVEGTAVRLGSSVPVYTERHLLDRTLQQVEYRDPQGTAIGTLELDYSCDAHAPAFEQTDVRAGMRLAGHWRAGRYVLTRAAINAGARARSATLAPEQPPLVASSGFDRYLRDNWERLAAGDALHLRFAMPGRLSSIGLRARREPGAADPSLTWFLIEPDATWLRLLADPIRVGYDTERRLRVYQGHSNLADADGAALSVEIRYRYPPAQRHEFTGAEPGSALQRMTRQSDCPAERT